MPSRVYDAEYFTRSKARLASVPLQVLLLHSPADEEIGSVIHNDAERIQAMTGEDVTVLVPIDATAPWVAQVSMAPTAWNRSPAAWTMLGQFVSLAGVRWDELPALVIGRSPFTGRRLIVRTSAASLVDQLRTVASVSKEMGLDVRVAGVRRALRQRHGEQRLSSRTVSKSAPDQVVDAALASVAGVVAFGETPKLEQRADWFESSPIEFAVYSRSFEQPTRSEPLLVTRLAMTTQAAIQSVRITPPVPEELDRLAQRLDDACRTFLYTALVLERPLEDLPFDPDFGAAGLPLCNLLERLLNLGPVQVARNSRGVPMPPRYTMFDPELPAGKALVDTSKSERSRYVDINQVDPHSPVGHHRFLTIGESRHVVHAMARDSLLRGSCLVEELKAIEQAAREIGAIRNQHAHAVPMGRTAWLHVREFMLDPNVLNHLVEMAEPLRS